MIAVIFLFLESLRNAIILAVTVPLSLVGLAFLMLILGCSINLLTLLAMALAIRMVVDDAIIVVRTREPERARGIVERWLAPGGRVFAHFDPSQGGLAFLLRFGAIGYTLYTRMVSSHQRVHADRHGAGLSAAGG